MKKRYIASFAALCALLALFGCGSSEPEHVEKPLKAVPPPSSPISAASTPEEKIKYIESSHAPDIEKQKAIAQVRAGKL